MFPFSYVLIAVITYEFFSQRKLKVLFLNFFVIELVFALSRMNYGYFVHIGGSELEYNDVLLGVLFVLSILVLIKNPRIPQKTSNISMLLLLTIFIGMLLCNIFPANVAVIDYNHSWDMYMRGFTSEMQPVAFSMQSVLMFIRVLIFVFVLNIAYLLFNEHEWVDIAKKVYKYLKGLIVYGVIEIVLKYALHINVNLYLNDFFGRGISTGGGVERLQGICREPSYYALALFNFMALSTALFYIEQNSAVKRKIRNWTIVSALIGIFTTSFSFMICIVALMLMWLYLANTYSSGRMFKVSIGICIVVCLAILIISSPFFLNFAMHSNITVLERSVQSVVQIKKAFTNTLIPGEDFSSEASRLGGGVITLKAGFARPLLGLGIGTTYCVTGLICIFANIGFIGLYLWIKLLFEVYGKNVSKMMTALLLLPVLFTNDLYTLYDTAYLLLIPIISIAMKERRKWLAEGQ
ncbi:MAG: hypothetical protein PHV18_06085 [Lachnospiraceae bacterium]|nr:hypothetical protein [Lachnospiraceae bacterium]